MFWIIHLFCVFFFIPALIITIPLHLVVSMLAKKQ